MDDSDADRAAIMAVLKAETDAWLRRDFEALAQHWVHSPQTRRLAALASRGVEVDEGWDVIGARIRSAMTRFPKHDIDDRIRWERVNIVVDGSVAWVSYDQIDLGDDFESAGVWHELKIFHRIGGTWKIGCLVLMQPTVEHATRPLIEVDATARVLWMNRPAQARMRDHPGLVAAAGRLRARRRPCDATLREAVAWAAGEARGSLQHRPARAVPLGEDEAAAPLFCWVVIEDGKVLVTFDDADMVARRIELAAGLYGLSPAQARLARLIVDGSDLAAAAGALGVSVTTARTQLQRMFDKTGARSQAALVRAMLSAEAPTK